MWIGNSLLDVPSNPDPNCPDPTPNQPPFCRCPDGTPVPGQFCQASTGQCFDATGLTTYTFVFPIEDLVIANLDICDSPLYVVTHAEVNYKDCDGTLNGKGDTAFGGDQCANCNRWWFYGQFIPNCQDCGEGNPPSCRTSYAKGGYVWTTDRRSNPENLPSLRLTRNRWGWAIKLTQTGTTTYQIWEGAGLNNTSNGLLVGTLTVIWDGTNVEVCYEITDGVTTISEVHIYAGDNSPTTIAPGQYGFIDSFDPGVTEYCATLPLADTNGGGVWVVAHAVTYRG